MTLKYKHMTREQYIKILQRELSKLNREIDLRIISGEVYSKEAKEHKIILNKIRQHRRKTFINKLFASFMMHA